MFRALGEASGGSGGSPIVCLPGKEFCVLRASLRDDVLATAAVVAAVAAYDGGASLCAVRERYEGTSETILGVSDSNAPYAKALATYGRFQL